MDVVTFFSTADFIGPEDRSIDDIIGDLGHLRSENSDVKIKCYSTECQIDRAVSLSHLSKVVRSFPRKVKESTHGNGVPLKVGATFLSNLQ